MRSTNIPILCTIIFSIPNILYTGEHKPCHLALMPLEILNHIAFFIPFPHHETEGEFIARTKTQEVSDFVPYALRTSYKKRNTTCVTAEYSPDKTKFVMIEKNNSDYNPDVVQIIDKHKKKAMYTGMLFNVPTAALAVSNKADMYAYVERDRHLIVKYLDLNRNNAVKKEQKFELQSCLCHNNGPISFNKQSTQIIVHHAKAVVTTKEDKCPISGKQSHTLFPLATAEKVKAEDIHKTIDEYFFNKLVCKSLQNSLKINRGQN